MRKIRLNAEALEVEGFATSGAEGRAGTVHARSESGPFCPTGYGNYTCVGYGSCDPYFECLYTGDLPTCGTAGC